MTLMGQKAGLASQIIASVEALADHGNYLNRYRTINNIISVATTNTRRTPDGNWTYARKAVPNVVANH
jgi:hypothetical protein